MLNSFSKKNNKPNESFRSPHLPRMCIAKVCSWITTDFYYWVQDSNIVPD